MKLADISQTYDPISPISDVRAKFQQNFDGLLKQIRGVVVISPEKVKLALLGGKNPSGQDPSPVPLTGSSPASNSRRTCFPATSQAPRFSTPASKHSVFCKAQSSPTS